VRLDAVEAVNNFARHFVLRMLSTLYCGVTVGDPATLTLPSAPGGWTQAVVIEYDGVWQYGPR
ncbi:hypothetical protein BaRGS_00035648, partial [Batillaria attramentaria]